MRISFYVMVRHRKIKFALRPSHVSEVSVCLVDFVPGSASGLSEDFGLVELVSDVVL